ncbi:MAG: response regulator [Phaeodactylibacter sp.]|nr:response regulator [Phaeodactylibacter sp.]
MNRILLIFFSTACLSLLGSQQVLGQPFEINSLSPSYSLSGYVYLMEESATYYTVEEVLAAGEQATFRPYTRSNEKLKSGVFYWAKVSLSNQLEESSGQSSWVMHIAPPFTWVEAYLVKSGRVVSQHHTGYFRPYSEKEFKPRVQPNLIQFQLTPGETAALYIRANASRPSMPPDFELRLMPTDMFWAQIAKDYWSHALFLGFVLMMLLYNVILTFTARDKAHFFYSFYLITIAGYHLYASRMLADWLGPFLFSSHPQYLYFFKLVAYFGLAAYMGFIRYFLNLKQLLPGWDRWFRLLMWLAIPVLALDAMLCIWSDFSPDIADLAIVPFTLAFLISTFLFLWPLYKTGDKKGYFVLAGIVAMGLGIFLTLVERFQSPEYGLLYYKTGSVLEIVAFALGLAYSRRQEVRDRQTARFELERSQLLRHQEHAEAERLKELNELKSRLYTNITHEFRTPLTVIMGMAAEVEDNEKAKNLILRNSANLLRLINQLLDLAKLESGKLELKFIQADIISYLQYVTESFQSMAAAKNIHLTFHSDEKELWMDFDEEKIQQISYNLLSNALKFTPEKGEVTLQARRELMEGRSFLQFFVQDSGIGIGKEDQVHIFNRFYQGDSVTYNEGGTGIGLALTRELIELMDGTISVESREGIGSRFTVSLPIKQEAKRLGPAQVKAAGSGLSFVNPDIAYKQGQQPADSLEDAPILLIVEDNPDVVTYIQSILDTLYITYVASNGRAGLEQAVTLIPDIIISDVMMPEMDGYELCDALKRDERTSHVPVILLTARTADEDRLAGLKRGADAYLTKPFNKEELLVRLKNLVEVRRLLQERYAQLAMEESPSDRKPDIEDAFLQKLRLAVEAALNDQDLSVTALGPAVNLSQAQVYRKLKALTGKTPSQFIRSIRLQKAVELLETTSQNISEIAYQVGFNDPNYFTRTFHQEFGKAPSEFRK